MSSKILVRSQSREVEPMAWRRFGNTSATADHQARVFEPAQAASSGEEAALRNRIAQLEHAGRAAVTEAHQRGLREGEEQGRSQAAALAKPVLDQMVKTVNDLCQLRPKLRRDAEADVVQLAVAIARRVLHRELSIDPSAMQALVQVALARLDRQEVHRVIVHSSQAAAIGEALEQCGCRATVAADPNRPAGSLIFETNRGKLDASINAQLDEIERGLADRVSHP